MSAAPPLFDFQVNGFGGIDFQHDDLTAREMISAVEALHRHETGGIFLTLITDTIERLCRRFEQHERLRASDPRIAEMMIGYHLEGPWLSPAPGYCGAHPQAPMHAPSEAEFKRLQAAAGGRIRLVTLAPEWPGSDAFIAMLARAGVHVALGHTQASDAEIDRAVAAGARFCTHLGNGVPLMLPRHDNVVQRLLARDELIACFIPDGIHVPPFALRNFFRAKPPQRVLFTTDAMAAAGMPPGRYALGELQIDVGTDGVARQPGGHGLAGSTLTPDEGVRRVATYLGLSVTAARQMWSQTARAAFGV